MGGFAGAALAVLVELAVLVTADSAWVGNAALGLLAGALLLMGLVAATELCAEVAAMELLCMINLSRMGNAIENLEKLLHGQLAH